MKKPTITGQIYETALRLLDEHPEGLRWSELLAEIETVHPDFHPKTVNGCVRVRLIPLNSGAAEVPVAHRGP